MANLLSIAEQSWKQLFPEGSSNSAITREEFVATAKTQYALSIWRKIKEDRREYGSREIPSDLLSEAEMDVKNNEIDLSDLHILRSIDQELWLQDVGGANCTCKYIKTTLSLWKTLCDDESTGEAFLYFPLGKKLVFPKGTHSKKLPIVYANNGQGLDETVIEVDDAIGGIVRQALIDIYVGKSGRKDDTNNGTPNS